MLIFIMRMRLRRPRTSAQHVIRFCIPLTQSRTHQNMRLNLWMEQVNEVEELIDKNKEIGLIKLINKHVDGIRLNEMG